jgi:hypothetical protein
MNGSEERRGSQRQRKEKERSDRSKVSFFQYSRHLLQHEMPYHFQAGAQNDTDQALHGNGMECLSEEKVCVGLL